MNRSGLSRRQWIAGAFSILPAWGASRPQGLLIDTHIHLFSEDQKRFAYHPEAPYKPPAQPLEAYAEFIRQSKIDHVIIVHPEPYQDDHRYLEYCFAKEPSPGFFKGTCLFDPIAPETPSRMEALVRRNAGRIVALRVHQMRKPGSPPATGGAIKDRDMAHPAMKTTWRKAADLGLAIQMHFLPYYATQIAPLASEFSGMPVILDHLGRAGQGRPEHFAEVLKLARNPRVYMKYSAVRYSSKEKSPFRDAKPLVRRAFDAFGPDRMIWGGLGHNMDQFGEAVEVFNVMFDFASETDRAKIRGLNAKKLYKF
ncbi:MAG: amidohydrolase family protein [Bryobacteraceae bacterium]